MCFGKHVKNSVLARSSTERSMECQSNATKQTLFFVDGADAIFVMTS
jgi:hypothetical protein